jgi:hypothetical protein
MSTKLEQIQAAAKAKLAAGQTLAAQPVTNNPVAVQAPTPVVGALAGATNQPKIAAPAVRPQTPVAAPQGNMKASSPAVSPAIQQEIQRKASAGIALTNPTAATQAAYNAAKPQVSPAVAVKTPAVQPGTNYVAQGGKTLNDILYLKDNYNAGNKNYIASQSNPLYAQLDSQTAAAVKGMNADQLRQYINSQGTQKTATTQNDPAVTGESPAPMDYTALATAAYQQQLDQLLAGAQSQEKELERRYDYANGVTQDNRQLETASFYRNNTPTAWDGSTGYQAAMNDRNRTIEDHYTSEGLTDATAAAYGTANAFRNNSNNFISTKANELQTAAQQLALQEADKTGTYKGQQTLAAQNQAYNQNADTRNFNYQVGQDTIANQLAQNNQAFNQNVTMAQITGYLPNGKPTSDQQQLQLQNLWTVAEQTGVIPDALATLYGLPKGTPTQSALQAAAQISISQQNANTSQYSAQNSVSNAGFGQMMDVWKATGLAPSGLEAYGVAPGEQWYQEAAAIKENSLTPQQVITNIRDLYQEPVYTNTINPLTGLATQTDSGKTKLTTEPAKRQQMFDNVVDSGLSNAETQQVLSSLGFSKEEITKLYNEGLSSGGL